MKYLRNFLSMIYKEDKEEPENLNSNFDPTTRGYQLIKQMGYNGKGGLGLHEQGR